MNIETFGNAAIQEDGDCEKGILHMENTKDCCELRNENQKEIANHDKEEYFKESLASNQEFGDEDLCFYLEGDLVWVNVKGSPLWPAMITIPQNDTSYTKFRLKKSTKETVGQRQFHVQFFCDNYRTMWMSSKTIIVYEGLENLKLYCEKLKLNVKSSKNSNLSAEKNLLKSFSKLRLRTISSNNSKSLQWNQAVLEADQVLPLERCERILKFKTPLVKESKEKYLYKNYVVEEIHDAKYSTSSVMSSIDLGSVSPFTSINKGKWKSPSSTYDSSDEFSGFKKDYSMEERKPKRRKSLETLNQGTKEALKDPDLDIKHEIEIKEEPLELCGEYLCHEYESMMYHKQTLENCNEVSSSLKPLKIKVENEDIEMKTEFFDYVEDDHELKIEIQGRCIGDANHDSKVEGNTLNHDSHVDEEILFRRLENSEFPKVVVRKLNIEKTFEICSDVPHLKKPCRRNFWRIGKHEETLYEVHYTDTEDNDYDKKADIDVRKEDIEDLIEDQSYNLNKDIICKRNFGARKRKSQMYQKECRIFLTLLRRVRRVLEMGNVILLN